MLLDRLLDTLDVAAHRAHLSAGATWQQALRRPDLKLYAGRLSRNAPQFKDYFGLTPFHASSRNIAHDLRDPLPIAGGIVSHFQAEDVFEHLDYAALPDIIDEIHRVLRPGGLFRLSVPDYRNPFYLARSLKIDGQVFFDPGGGGQFKNGQVVDGGHLWFPVAETVQALFERSAFWGRGEVRFLHYNDVGGASVLRTIDYADGFVRRTPDHDSRTPGKALSIVVDAIKWHA